MDDFFFTVDLARRNTQLVPMDLSPMGSQDQKFQELTVTWRETVERKLKICKTTKQVDGLGTDDKGKGKNDKGKGKHRQREKKGFHETEGHDDAQDKQVNITQNGLTRVFDHADSRLTQTCTCQFWTSEQRTDVTSPS